MYQAPFQMRAVGRTEPDYRTRKLGHLVVCGKEAVELLGREGARPTQRAVWSAGWSKRP